MKAYLVQIGFGMTMFMLAGCASIAQHGGNLWTAQSSARYVYSGTQADIQAIRGPKEPDLSPVFLGRTMVFVSIFDFPLSLAVDTLLLPVDACIMTIGDKTREGADRHPKPPPEPK